MSELPLRAPCANRSVRAAFAGASDSLTSDQVVDLRRVGARTIRCGLNRLMLHAVRANARDTGHRSAMSSDHPLRTGRPIADLRVRAQGRVRPETTNWTRAVGR